LSRNNILLENNAITLYVTSYAYYTYALPDPESFRKRLTNNEERDAFCQVGPISCSRDEPSGTKNKSIHISVEYIESVNFTAS
jgi:hypothetical protein